MSPLLRGIVFTLASAAVAQPDRAPGPDDVIVEQNEFASTERDELIIDEPLPLIAFEEHGLSLADVIGAAGSTSNELMTAPVYRDVVSTLTADLAELNARPNIGEVPTNLRVPNRPFDPRWLSSDKTHFELVGVVDRIDRIFVDHQKCGEARLVYRLALRPRDRPETRLPMTINIAFPQPQEHGKCVSIAKTWLGFANRLRRDDVVNFFRGLPHFDRLEVNLQNMHGPALRKNEDDHAEYLLRSFRIDKNRAFVGPLLNTPRADLSPDELASWIEKNFTAIDHGEAVLPDAMSATREISVTPRGLARPKNRAYQPLLAPLHDRLASLPYLDATLARSYALLVRRLDEMACAGCHQAHAVAGFHLLGNERNANESFNALEVGTSAHLDGELRWRRELLQRTANEEAFYFPRPFAERSSELVPYGSHVLGGGGYGAHCGLVPELAAWSCDEGFFCRDWNHDEVGQCSPDAPDRPGDACQNVKLTATDSPDGDRITAERAEKCVSFETDPTASCSPNAFGFPGGLCSDACTEVGKIRGDVICADLPVSGFESDCFPSSEPIESCQARHSIRREVRACDRDHPCRDDFGCARVANARPGIGACVPPYFVLQGRVDGPERDR